jgi:hypothetical protein
MEPVMTPDFFCAGLYRVPSLATSVRYSMSSSV